MAYIILVNDDNTITASKKERIMQKSKLFSTLHFLAPPTYKGYDMSLCTVVLEYVLPVSKKYESEILELSEEGYEEYLKYTLPFDTNLTSEPGKIELQLTFIYSDMDENGKSIQRVRKTSTCFVEILPISAWSDVVPDGALSAIDQRIIKLDSQLKEMADIGNAIIDTKADNIKYDKKTSALQLLSGAKEIGDAVIITNDDNDDPNSGETEVVEF